jgi:hypothetical protein
MLKHFFHSLHQTPLSRALKRSAILGIPARYFWHRHHAYHFRKRLGKIKDSRFAHIQPPTEVALPIRSMFLKPTPAFQKAGENFSSQLAPFETSKFHTMAYQYAYAHILAQIPANSIRTILEIGMGTNNPDKPSGMPKSHRPGTSLAGWKHIFPFAEVFGADVDRSILQDTVDYRALWVDQLSMPSLEALARTINRPLDLVVDDGLHTPEANANSMAALLPHLSPTGVFVVEDILEEFDDLWELVGERLGNSFKASFIPCGALNSMRSESTGMGIALICRA